jgi:UDP-glucose 4-epimerase
LTDPVAVAQSVEGADWIFHLAALLHLPRPRPELRSAYERVNVEGTRLVAAAAAASGVTRLVFFSSIAVYGATGPEGADESTPPQPESIYARTKLSGEEAVRAADGRAALRTCVLRLAAVYGSRVKGNYERLARGLASGWFVPVGPGTNRRTLVHEADVAEAALLVGGDPRAAGRLYNVSDGHIHRLRDILEAIARAGGRRPPRIRLPLGPTRLLARLGDAGLAPFYRGPVLTPLLDRFTEDVAVRAERIVRELGFRPRFDLESGWRDALRGDSARP